MRTLRKSRPLQVTLLGGLVMMGSLLFEYARMEPDYRFIVEPWSVRGYEVTQGWVIFAIAASITILALLIAYDVLSETLTSGAIAVAATTLVAAVIAVIADPRDIVLATLAVWLLAAVGASAVTAGVEMSLPKKLSSAARRLIGLVVWLASFFVLGALVLGPIFDGSRPLWLVVVIILAGAGTGVLVRKPRALATRRLLINASFGALVVAATIGGSVRTALLQLQREEIGAAADYLDTQITSGIILTWIGGVLMIVGAVSMWAKRREQLEAIERASQQREAALKSAEELGEEEIEARV
ncbi:MAG: hypothetical protein R3290_05750 [Acidimicrobiia bacterium]|nr:hypothetical protein [Acidimicrobiia bacterium]